MPCFGWPSSKHGTLGFRLSQNNFLVASLFSNRIADSLRCGATGSSAKFFVFFTGKFFWSSQREYNDQHALRKAYNFLPNTFRLTKCTQFTKFTWITTGQAGGLCTSFNTSLNRNYLLTKKNMVLVFNPILATNFEHFQNCTVCGFELFVVNALSKDCWPSARKWIKSNSLSIYRF